MMYFIYFKEINKKFNKKLMKTNIVKLMIKLIFLKIGVQNKYQKLKSIFRIYMKIYK